MLEIEKTLVYFMTSLKSNDTVLGKLSKGNVLPLYERDAELLEDAINHFQSIIDYKDSQEQIKKFESEIEKNKKEIKKDRLLNIIFGVMGGSIIVAFIVLIIMGALS